MKLLEEKALQKDMTKQAIALKVQGRVKNLRNEAATK